MIQDTWFKAPDVLCWLGARPEVVVGKKIEGKAIQEGNLTHPKWPFGYKFVLTDKGELYYRPDFIPEVFICGWKQAEEE